MNNVITYTDHELLNITNNLYGAKIATMSIDWLYNPKKAISEKSVLYILDGYHESVTVQKLLNMHEYHLI